MKLKVDFITNSSSASFTILRSNLTPEQELLIYDHLEAAAMISQRKPGHYDFGYISKMDEWTIREDSEKIYGDTSMDNFSMLSLLEAIGVPSGHIDYDHS